MSRQADAFVDITDVICPVTLVKVQVALEEIADGQVLEIKMNNGEPLQNVPRSLKEEGHRIVAVTKNTDGTFTVFVQKGTVPSDISQ